MLALGLTTFKLRPVQAGGSAPAVPVNTVQPSMTMTTGLIGETISVDNGTWDVTPDEYEYQLQAGDNLVSGATSNSFVLTVAEAGLFVFFEVRARLAGGSWSDWAPANSEQTTGLIAPFAVTPPVIANNGSGEFIFTTGTTWGANPPDVTQSFQWQEDTGSGFADIPGETGTSLASGSYTPGATIRVIVTGSNGVSPDATAISNGAT